LFFRNGIKDLDAIILENIISSGTFLTYSSDHQKFIKNDFYKALTQIVREIRRLKQFEIEFPMEKQGELNQMISGHHNFPDKKWRFSFFDLALLNSIYKRLINIQNLTGYLIQYIDTHDENIKYPCILNGLIESERPSEEEILRIYQ